MLFAVEFEKALRDSAPIRYAASADSDPMHRPMGFAFTHGDYNFEPHAPRGVVADYLDENGRGEEAAMLRRWKGDVAEHEGKLRTVPELRHDRELQQYLDTALWSTYGPVPRHDRSDEDDDEDEIEDEPLDHHYDLSHFTPQSLIKAKDDLEKFRRSLSEAATDEIDTKPGYDHAHDLWLTRNGHGAGFWDGDWEHGDELSDAARRLGEQDIEVEHHGDTDPERVGEYSLHLRGG